MKKYIIALAASAAIMGAAQAQQGTPTATEMDQNATTVPAEQAEPMTSTDAPQSGNSPTATESETDATTATQPVVPETGTEAPQSATTAQ